MIGVSNGGNAVLRFATMWPELCRGRLVITTGVAAGKENWCRLRGLPIDIYVGGKDEYGFYPMVTALEAALRTVQHSPRALLTVFEDGGHSCSPLIDDDLIAGKIKLMLLHSSQPGTTMKLPPPQGAYLSTSDILHQLGKFCDELGLELEIDATGQMCVKLSQSKVACLPSTSSTSPNVILVPTQDHQLRSPSLDTSSRRPSMRLSSKSLPVGHAILGHSSSRTSFEEGAQPRRRNRSPCVPSVQHTCKSHPAVPKRRSNAHASPSPDTSSSGPSMPRARKYLPVDRTILRHSLSDISVKQGVQPRRRSIAQAQSSGSAASTQSTVASFDLEPQSPLDSFEVLPAESATTSQIESQIEMLRTLATQLQLQAGSECTRSTPNLPQQPLQFTSDSPHSRTVASIPSPLAGTSY
jgi:hypothetical protein